MHTCLLLCKSAVLIPQGLNRLLLILPQPLPKECLLWFDYGHSQYVLVENT